MYFSSDLVGTYSVFQSFYHLVFKMAAANGHQRCGAVNLPSRQSRFYLSMSLAVGKWPDQPEVKAHYTKSIEKFGDLWKQSNYSLS